MFLLPFPGLAHYYAPDNLFVKEEVLIFCFMSFPGTTTHSLYSSTVPSYYQPLDLQLYFVSLDTFSTVRTLNVCIRASDKREKKNSRELKLFYDYPQMSN